MHRSKTPHRARRALLNIVAGLVALVFLEVFWLAAFTAAFSWGKSQGPFPLALTGLISVLVLVTCVTAAAFRHRRVRLGLFIFSGFFLAIYLAMGVYAGVKGVDIPVPHLHEDPAIGWRAGGHRAGTVRIVLGYDGGRRPDGTTLALCFRGYEEPRYLGILVWIEPGSEYHLCESTSRD